MTRIPTSSFDRDHDRHSAILAPHKMYHKAFEVSIHCEGRPLPEFSTKVDNRTVSCFVASEVGKVFSIKWSSHINSFVTVNCVMDGHPMGCTTVKPRRSGSREGIRTSPTTHRLFRFAPLYLGTEVRCNAQTPSNKVTYIDKPDEPYVKFIFRYRPREFLKADGIATVPIMSSGPDRDHRRITRQASKRKLEESGSGTSSGHPNKRRRMDINTGPAIDIAMNNVIPRKSLPRKVKREPSVPDLRKAKRELSTPALRKVKRELSAPDLRRAVKKEPRSHPNFRAVGPPDVIDLTED
ncbi:hypothetical protein B0H21DRAFT_772557, partial [Amylocystis lapponica]